MKTFKDFLGEEFNPQYSAILIAAHNLMNVLEKTNSQDLELIKKARQLSLAAEDLKLYLQGQIHDARMAGRT